MIRPNRTTPSRSLLEIARSPAISIQELENILNILAERKNNYALFVCCEVGKLLEQAKERKRREDEIEELRQEERRRDRLQQGYFDWPSTDAPASTSGFCGNHWSYKDGLLSFVGYRVGRNGLDKQNRQRILDCVFHNDLPQVDSVEYMRQWDEPKSAARLQKMAESLAAFTRNAKRKALCDYRDAVADWETDLTYLHDEYYRGFFGFSWPTLKGPD